MSNEDEPVELEIVDVAYGGDGVGRLESGLTVFVPFTAVGDRVQARIVEQKKNFARAELVQVLTPGEGRTQPRCPYYGECGGCQYQHLTPETELQLKANQLAETIRRLGPLKEVPEVAPIIGKSPYGYRKKIVLHPDAETRAYGFYRHDNETVIPIETCPIAAPEIQQEVARLSPDDVKSLPLTLRLAANDRVYRYYGKAPRKRTPWLRDELLGQNLHVPLNAFTQINDEITAELISWLRQTVHQQACHLLVDLYCGSGMFALALREQAERVIGIELDRESIRAAQLNARKWDAPHVKFESGRVESLLPSVIESHPGGEHVTVVLDPPRSGCDKQVMRMLGTWAPQRIIYISCDPTTQARDLQRLYAKTSYRLEHLALFDMFPQTAHFESVAILHRAE